MSIETAVKSVSGGQIEDFALAAVMARRSTYKQKNEKKYIKCINGHKVIWRLVSNESVW